MTLKTPIFLENNTTSQNADELRLERLYQYLSRGGAQSATAFKVSQRGAGANMSVDVAAGGAVVVGTENALQGAYHVTNDAVVNLAVSAADLTNPRKDLVIVNVRDTFYSGASNDAQLQVVAGTPAASPAEPNLVSLGYKNYLVLAMIDVPASDTSITDGQITDRRFRATLAGGIMRGSNAVMTALTGMAEGDYFYDETNDRLYEYSGSLWRPFAAPIPHSDSQKVTSAAGTTTSASFVNLGVSCVVSNFVKHRADTKLTCLYTGSVKNDNTLGEFEVAVLVNGVDNTIAHGFGGEGSKSGVIQITGLAAGTYSPTLRRRRVNGVGNVSDGDSGAFNELLVTETL